MPKIVVFCDVDGVLKRKAMVVSSETVEEIVLFQQNGDIFSMVTGAPLAHVPDIPAYLILAESGGVIKLAGVDGFGIFEPGREAINELRWVLQIYEEDGMVHTPHGSLIVEGPRRYTSMTFLFGEPPHYPGRVTSAQMEEVNTRLRRLIQRLPLTLSVGHDTSYSYIDVFSMTKRQSIQTAMQKAGWDSAYVAGDRYPDYEAMLLPGVIPVGFSNSIEEIRVLAQEIGVYINLPGPEGGVAEFFRRLNNGQL